MYPSVLGRSVIPAVDLLDPTSTANVDSKAGGIGKRKGTMIYRETFTDLELYVSKGSSPDDVWEPVVNNSSGTTDHAALTDNLEALSSKHTGFTVSLNLLDYVIDTTLRTNITTNNITLSDTGETDLKTIIAALVADIPDEGCHITIPSGTWMTSEGFLITSKNNVTLEFQGGARLYQHPATPANSVVGAHVFVNSNGQPCWAYKFTLCNNIKVINPYLDGNWLNVDAECWKRPFVFDRCDNAHVIGGVYDKFKYGGDFRDCSNSGEDNIKFGQNWYGKIADNGHIYKTEGLNTGLVADFETGYPYADATSWQWSGDLCIHFVIQVHSVSPDTYKFCKINGFYADVTERLAASLSADETGYIYLQESDNTLWEWDGSAWGASDTITWVDNSGSGYAIETAPAESQMPGESGGGSTYPKISWASGYTAVATDRWYFQWREDRIGFCNHISNIDVNKIWGSTCPQVNNYRINCFTSEDFIDGGFGGIAHQKNFKFQDNKINSGVQFRQCHGLDVTKNDWINCIENCIDMETCDKVTISRNYFENYEWAAVHYTRPDNLDVATTDHVAAGIDIFDNVSINSNPRTTYASYTDGHSSHISINAGNAAVDGIDGLNIHHNILIDTLVTPTTMYGIWRGGNYSKTFTNVKIDDNTISNTLTADYSPELLQYVNRTAIKIAQTVTIYVDPVGTGDGSSTGTGAVATIQEAWDRIPETYSDNFIISISGGTDALPTEYIEDLVLTGKRSINDTSIIIQGETETLIAPFQNTEAAGKYTRVQDSGASLGTTNQGKLAVISAGAGAGDSFIIRNNTTTQLDFAGSITTGSFDTTTYCVVYGWATKINGSITINGSQHNITLKYLNVIGGDILVSDQSKASIYGCKVEQGDIATTNSAVSYIYSPKVIDGSVLGLFGAFSEVHRPYLDDSAGGAAFALVFANDLASIALRNGWYILGDTSATIGQLAQRQGSIRHTGGGFNAWANYIDGCLVGIQTSYGGLIQPFSTKYATGYYFGTNGADISYTELIDSPLALNGDIVQTGTHEATSYKGGILDSTGATLVDNTAKTFNGTASVATKVTATATPASGVYHIALVANPTGSQDVRTDLSALLKYDAATRVLETYKVNALVGFSINGTPVTATATALNFVDLTSSAQTQLNAKAPKRVELHAYLTADHVLASTADIITGSSPNDWASYYSNGVTITSAGVFTLPTIGTYRISYSYTVEVLTTATRLNTDAYVNGVRILTGRSSSGTSTVPFPVNTVAQKVGSFSVTTTGVNETGYIRIIANEFQSGDGTYIEGQSMSLHIIKMD